MQAAAQAPPEPGRGELLQARRRLPRRRRAERPALGRDAGPWPRARPVSGIGDSLSGVCKKEPGPAEHQRLHVIAKPARALGRAAALDDKEKRDGPLRRLLPSAPSDRGWRRVMPATRVLATGALDLQKRDVTPG